MRSEVDVSDCAMKTDGWMLMRMRMYEIRTDDEEIAVDDMGLEESREGREKREERTDRREDRDRDRDRDRDEQERAAR
jgi:hypothetical protein